MIGIFVSLALFVYNKYVAPRLNPDFVPNKEFIDTEKHDSIDNGILYYFRADWCPICKKVDPIITELENFYKQNPIENVEFKVIIIKCYLTTPNMANKKFTISCLLKCDLNYKD